MTFAATILTLFPEMFAGPLGVSLAGGRRTWGSGHSTPMATTHGPTCSSCTLIRATGRGELDNVNPMLVILIFNLCLPALFAGTIARGEFIKKGAAPTFRRLLVMSSVAALLPSMLSTIAGDIGFLGSEPVGDLVQLLVTWSVVTLFPCLLIMYCVSRLAKRPEPVDMDAFE